jgi:hypothetical protein
MTIARRAITVTSSAAANSVVVNKPTGTVDGDLMLAIFCHATGTTDVSLAAPAGWTMIGSAGVNGDLNGKAWYHVAASEGASYTFTSSTSNDGVIMIASYSGVDTTTPINTSAQNYPASTSATCSIAVTTTAANCMLVMFVIADTGATETMTWTGSMTEFQDGTYEATFLVLGGAQEQATTATTYTRVATKSGTNRRLSGHLIALNEAAAVSGIVNRAVNINQAVCRAATH